MLRNLFKPAPKKVKMTEADFVKLVAEYGISARQGKLLWAERPNGSDWINVESIREVAATLGPVFNAIESALDSLEMARAHLRATKES